MAIINRAGLSPDPMPGPIVIEEYDATTVVPPGCTARLDALGSIEIDVRG